MVGAIARLEKTFKKSLSLTQPASRRMTGVALVIRLIDAMPQGC